VLTRDRVVLLLSSEIVHKYRNTFYILPDDISAKHKPQTRVEPDSSWAGASGADTDMGALDQQPEEAKHVATPPQSVYHARPQFAPSLSGPQQSAYADTGTASLSFGSFAGDGDSALGMNTFTFSPGVGIQPMFAGSTSVAQSVPVWSPALPLTSGHGFGTPAAVGTITQFMNGAPGPDVSMAHVGSTSWFSPSDVGRTMDL